jgi:hypothetical protein
MFQSEDVHYEMTFLRRFIVLQILAIAVLSAQPKLAFDPGCLIDLGDQYSGQQIVRTVLLRNTGSEPLRLFSVEPSCGCTAVLLERNDSTIAPSDSEHLVIMYTLENRTGAASKAVVITSNDPAAPLSTIVISGFITARLEILPPFIVFGTMEQDTTFHSTLMLRNTQKEGFLKILSVTSDVAGLTYEVSADSLAAGQETIIDVSYKPVGNLKGDAELRILTNQETEPVYTIPLKLP